MNHAVLSRLAPAAPLRLAWMVVLLTAGIVGSSMALPRYSAIYEQNCGLCHMNPSGGGQRTQYAVRYLLPGDLSGHRFSKERAAAIDPQIGQNVTIGADLRTIYHFANKSGIGYDDFLQMEGEVYLTFQLDPKFMAYVDRATTTSGEIFGTAYLLPFHGYVKVGRFVPAYGWRFDDHTMFVVQKPLQPTTSPRPTSVADLSGVPPVIWDVGTELAVFPGRLALTASVVNGNRGSIFDNNRQPAYAAQAICRGSAGKLGLGLGGSFWRNTEDPGRRTAGGPYGYLKFDRLAWLAEADWSTLKLNKSVLSQDTTGILADQFTSLTISQELSCRLVRGVELLGVYDFHDPDTAHKNGARTRYGAGLAYTAYPFVMIQTTVNRHHFQRGDLAAGQDYTQLEVLTHFFY
jgi:hypothetical protein